MYGEKSYTGRKEKERDKPEREIQKNDYTHKVILTERDREKEIEKKR
jgi:hypothetical protein